MLVTFKCDVHADIILFGDIAKRLLKMMGHSGTVPGAILAEDIPVALDRLKGAIEAEKSAAVAAATSEPADDVQSAEQDDQAVRFEYRALPLIELLTAASKNNCNVMWE